MLVVIDNFDSFTHNILHIVDELGYEYKMFRNNEITIAELKKINPNKIIISPGPGSPDDSGISIEVIKNFYRAIPILGVCLGHQCIGQIFGAKVIKAKNILHGKTSQISHAKNYIFKNLPSPFRATRYHSLILDNMSMPNCLEVIATVDDEIMAIRHREHPVYGVQFHPEAILTEHGKVLIENFLSYDNFSKSLSICPTR